MDLMDTIKRANSQEPTVWRGPGRPRALDTLATIAAACGTVANRRSGATSAVVVLGVGEARDVLAHDLLERLEQRYQVHIAVLDEGSPTMPSVVRITRPARATASTRDD
jgi:hypothetical protein